MFYLKILLRLVEEKQEDSCEKVDFFVGKDFVFESTGKKNCQCHAKKNQVFTSLKILSAQIE